MTLAVANDLVKLKLKENWVLLQEGVILENFIKKLFSVSEKLKFWKRACVLHRFMLTENIAVILICIMLITYKLYNKFYNIDKYLISISWPKCFSQFRGSILCHQ